MALWHCPACITQWDRAVLGARCWSCHEFGKRGGVTNPCKGSG